jgi:hypothetical protein
MVFNAIFNNISDLSWLSVLWVEEGRRDRIVVVFTTTYANIVYHHSSRDLESRLWRVYTIQHYVRVCQ